MVQTVKKIFIRRSQSFAIGMFCLFLILPLCLTGSCNVSSFSSIGGQALASFGDRSADAIVLDHMSDREKKRHKEVLRSLLTDMPDTFYNLVESDIALILNTPHLKRHDGHDTVWQYRSESCILDLFFKTINDQKIITHYETRPRRKAVFIDDGHTAVAPHSDQSCLATIL